MTDSLNISLAQLDPTVGDIDGNLAQIREARKQAAEQRADLVIYSELNVCGYPPEDLVLKPAFQERCAAAVQALAAETAKFAVTEVRIGLIPAVISPYLVQAIGPRWARRYFLTAETFDAREAERIGLVHGVFKPDQLDLAVNQVCDLLVANGPKALAASKDMLRFVSRGPIDDAMIAETAARIARIRVTQEGREGIASFLEKRKPGWRS